MIKKLYCIKCDKITSCTLKEEKTKKIIDGIEIEFKEKKYICNDCHEEVYDSELFDYNVHVANDELRKQTGLIRKEEIKQIVDKYNIGNKALSLVLGFGEIQIDRYLKSSNPSKDHSDILKSVLNNPFIFELYLLNNKDKISSNVFKKSLGKTKQLELIHEHSKLYIVGQYILEKYEDITNMSIQKILYFINGFAPIFIKHKLFDELPEAWVHGPVYKDIYDAFSYYTKDNINIEEILKDNISLLSVEEIEYLDKIIPYFARYSGSTLRNISHLTEPWKKAREGLNEEDYTNRIIENNDIQKYFKDVSKKYKFNEIVDVKKYVDDLVDKI